MSPWLATEGLTACSCPHRQKRDGKIPRQVLLRYLLPSPLLPAEPPRPGEAQQYPLPALLTKQPEDDAGGHGDPLHHTLSPSRALGHQVLLLAHLGVLHRHLWLLDTGVGSRVQAGKDPSRPQPRPGLALLPSRASFFWPSASFLTAPQPGWSKRRECG